MKDSNPLFSPGDQNIPLRRNIKTTTPSLSCPLTDHSPKWNPARNASLKTCINWKNRKKPAFSILLNPASFDLHLNHRTPEPRRYTRNERAKCLNSPFKDSKDLISNSLTLNWSRNLTRSSVIFLPPTLNPWIVPPFAFPVLTQQRMSFPWMSKSKGTLRTLSWTKIRNFRFFQIIQSLTPSKMLSWTRTISENQPFSWTMANFLSISIHKSSKPTISTIISVKSPKMIFSTPKENVPKTILRTCMNKINKINHPRIWLKGRTRNFTPSRRLPRNLTLIKIKTT